MTLAYRIFGVPQTPGELLEYAENKGVKDVEIIITHNTRHYGEGLSVGRRGARFEGIKAEEYELKLHVQKRDAHLAYVFNTETPDKAHNDIYDTALETARILKFRGFRPRLNDCGVARAV